MPSINDDRLPHVTSSVERFLVNPDGNADGMILGNGVEVYFAPHLSTAVLTAIHIGDRITVYGELPMAEPMIVAAIIESANGTRIEDGGAPTRRMLGMEADTAIKPRERSRLVVEALVRRTLHGPDGETRGVLLDDGTTVVWTFHGGEDYSEFLCPASWLAVRGTGLATEIGTAIEADEIGRSAQDMRAIQH
jgi:hypothetical protein